MPFCYLQCASRGDAVRQILKGDIGTPFGEVLLNL